MKNTTQPNNSRQIRFSTYPTRYGNNNLTEAFEKKEIGFELEIQDKNSIQRNLLTLEEVLTLRDKINASIDSYCEFMRIG
jgi:hypothetical protein